MSTSLDLDAYLARIGIAPDGLRPDLPTLSRLLRAHIQSIPFENLDVLLGRPIRIDMESIQRKLVAARRGGYCYEHAPLFAAALRSLGYEPPQRHAARVLLALPRDQAPRTHLFLSLRVDGRRYVVDPGFGGLSAFEPLPIDQNDDDASGAAASPADDGPHAAPAASHWLARNADGQWALHARGDDGQVIQAWVSTLEPELPVDAELGNHYTSTHPRSPFVNRLFLRAFDGETRISLLNRELTIRCGDAVERSQLPDRAALRTLLADHCGFDLPELEALRVPTIPEWGGGGAAK